MAFKVHKIKTVLRHLAESWPNSAFVVAHAPRMNRLSAYFSLLYWFYFYGNDFNDYCTFRFWDKTREEKKSYISLRRNNILRFALSTPEVHKLFLDKARFNQRFGQYINRRWMPASDASDSDVERFIHENGVVIAKPLTDFGGHGIIKITASGASNTPPHSYLRKNGYLLEECIENIDSIKRIAPESLNTVRIVTLIDKENKLHILAALLRMGNGSAFTDNYHDGGMACAIDTATGTLRGRAFGMDCAEYEKHPLSGIRFDGYRIEQFEECLELIRRIAFEEPRARYVGWDLAITPNGIELLEGNIPPGEDITQISAGRGLWHEINKLI